MPYLNLKDASGPQLQAVDPLFQAARVRSSPFDYTLNNQVLGHYRATFQTAAAAFASSAPILAFRWADPSRICLVTRILAHLTVITAVTAQRLDPLGFLLARQYTARDATNATSFLPVATKSNAMRSSMSSSILSSLAGGNIDGASAAAGLSGGIKTLDTDNFALCPCSGTSAVTGLGTGVPRTEVFKADVANGEHPIVLAQNEGIIGNFGFTALATGTVQVYCEISWAELAAF